MSIATESQEVEGYLIKTRRYFHAFPELSFQEQNTAEIIEEELTNLGLEPRRIAKTGVIADIKGLEPGKTVAIRADMDALPIEEKNSSPSSLTAETMDILSLAPFTLIWGLFPFIDHVLRTFGRLCIPDSSGNRIVASCSLASFMYSG